MTANTPTQAPSIVPAWLQADTPACMAGAVDDAQRHAASVCDALTGWRHEAIGAPYGVEFARVRELALTLAMELRSLHVAAQAWEAAARQGAAGKGAPR